MAAASHSERSDEIPTLPGQAPVTMPELPLRLTISTAEQFKAIAEPTRTRILGIIQNQPATAKQIADRLKIAPGAAGHHLQTLEAAGLAQVVAKRLVRGIVAKYYARTARIFNYDIPPEVTGGLSPTMEIATAATNELAEAVAELELRPDTRADTRSDLRPDTGAGASGRTSASGAEADCAILHSGFPHARLSPERAREYQARLDALVDELIAEPHETNGQVYGLFVAFFRSPTYMQSAPPEPGEPGAAPGDDDGDDGDDDDEGGKA